MARVSPSFALSWGASTGLFGANVLGKGTPDQVERFAMPVLRSERIGAWGLTEPGAGSDALSGMRTTARRDGDHYVLNGSKTFITNAPYADVFLVYARVQGGDLDASIQPFLVERTDAGLSTGPPMKKMGMRGSPTGEIFLDDLRIPPTACWAVRASAATKSSPPPNAGARSCPTASPSAVSEIARDYAKTRTQFGQPIAQFQLVQQRLCTDVVALSNCRRIVTTGCRSLVARVGGRRLRRQLYCADGTFVAFEAIHILAGNGYMEECGRAAGARCQAHRVAAAPPRSRS
jgi:alkylation response protein AidB-like acyl-CoA dehydrogenase